MKVYLIGAGCGVGSMTEAARDAVADADLILGPERLLREHASGRPSAVGVRSADILTLLRESGAETVCVLLSGDSGFYSGAKRLLPLLETEEVHILPGISSVQAFAALLGRSWQEWKLCSAHGADCDAVAAVCGGAPAFFLTGGPEGPASLCRQLVKAGLGELCVTVGEDLGGGGERVVSGTAEEFSRRTFSPLNVMLAEAAPRIRRRTPGLPDECFERAEKIPMTKREIRAAVLGLLAVGPADICWDIGAGSGSVGIEMAMQARSVCAVERDASAQALAEKNRRALGAWNLRLFSGTAPEALSDLPAPDAVFVGGSGGRLRDIVKEVFKANSRVRICISAVTLETLHDAVSSLAEQGREAEVTQIAVSRSKAVAGLHMMTAQNPVYLVTGADP